jgi:hypothetical protein
MLAGHIPREPAHQRGGLRLNPVQLLAYAAKRSVLPQQRDLLKSFNGLG